MGEKLHDVDLGNDFLGMISKSTGNRSKNRQTELHQTTKLLFSKENSQHNERKSMEREKYLQTLYPIRGYYRNT